jgi:hypothetical protein
MKNILSLTVLAISLFLIPFTLGAQEEDKTPWPKHGPRFSDSSDLKDFSCVFDDFDMDDFPFCKHRKTYNGHWAGVEIGIGGYVTPDFDMNFNPDYPYLNMNTARSVMVNLNPFDLNVNLYRNKIGFTTGLGFQISNYYFTGNYVMLKDSSTLVAYNVQDQQGYYVNMKVNKLVVSYLNIPLLFEFQTNRFRRLSSFHITLGVIGGVRIGSYTKQVYEDKEASYFLVDENGKQVASFDTEHHTVHDRGAYHLSPFKVDAAFRIGWSHLNLFSTYSFTRMFQKDQGPEIYPFTVGLTLLGW